MLSLIRKITLLCNRPNIIWCPYLLKFVDVDLVVNVDVAYRYNQNGIQ